MTNEECKEIWYDLFGQTLDATCKLTFPTILSEYRNEPLSSIISYYIKTPMHFRLCYCTYWMITHSNLEEDYKSRLLEMMHSPDHDNLVVIISILKSMSSKLVYPIAPDGQAK